MKSIERYLFAWIMGALVLGSMLVAMTTYLVTLDEMNEVFDADLQNVARGVASYQTHADQDQRHVPVFVPRHDVPDDSEIATFAWNGAGQLVHTSDPRVLMPRLHKEGLSLPTLNGEEWIVYTSVFDAGVAQAAQRVSARHQSAGESAAKILLPLLALAVVVGGLLVFGLRRGLRPLDSAARDVADRSVRSLAPIPVDDVPREIAPLVRSINDLMARLSEAFNHERRFMADAAHELRTPVTALKLQLQMLGRSPDESSRATAMQELEQGIARSQRLIEQLLQVARTGPEAAVSPMQLTDVSTIVRHVVTTLSIKAEAWQIDLGADLVPVPAILGDPEQLTVLLNNLVENALRFTPSGGVVDVAVRRQDERVELEVTDGGAGISEAQLTRVFDRFFRGDHSVVPDRPMDGSGLGLAIVKAIADRHGAVVALNNRVGVGGLSVKVSFPLPSSEASTSMVMTPGRTCL